MKKPLALLSLFISITSFSQIENNNWAFGHQALLDFSTTPPTAGYSNSSSVYEHSYASVSNNTGQLLFYTNGVKVWDRNGNIIPGGNNIGGGITVGGYVEQGVIIVPKPGSETVYYIFTVCKFEDTPPYQNHAGFHYSVVNINQDGSNGSVTFNNVPLKDEAGVNIDYDYSTNTGLRIFESSITSALNNTGDKIWVTIFTRFHINNVVKRVAYSYLVGSNGINGLPDGTSPAPYLNSYSNLPLNCPYPFPIGCLDKGGSIKISPDAQYLVNEAKGDVDLYYFDNITGLVQYYRKVYAVVGVNFYPNPGFGVEFSPNSQFIYFSSINCGLCQAKLRASRSEDDRIEEDPITYIEIRQALVNPSKGDTSTLVVGQFELPEGESITPIGSDAYGDIQLAIDGKIYLGAYDPSNPSGENLGVIHQPNIAGIGCQYINNGLTLASGTLQRGSLPQWVHKVVTQVWPKAYGTVDGPFSLIHDYQGNVVFTPHYIYNNTPFYNHMGAMPPGSWTYTHNVHYDRSGVTNWVKEDDYAWFAFRSGIIQISTGSGTHYFIDGSTGNTVPAPVTVGQDERIIAETNNGDVITFTNSGNNGDIKVYPVGGGSSTVTITGYNIVSYKYNLSTDDLFIFASDNSSNRLIKYDFNGTSLSLSPGFPISTSLSLMSFTMNVQNEIFFIDSDDVLKKYDYTNPTPNTVSVVSILGFNNLDLVGSGSHFCYADGKLAVFSQDDDYLYSLDVTSGAEESKRISTQNFSLAFNHAIDGDDFYLSGWYCSFCGPQETHIGNQVLPNVNLNGAPVYVTMLDLQNDFQRNADRNTGVTIKKDLKLIISPNPARSLLNLRLYDDKEHLLAINTVTITNQMGRGVLSKEKYPGGTIDLSGLPTGVYYITVTNEKGAKISAVFFKM